ncbi:MAG TPA: MFS transporter [Terriglobia bacterium]|jgi:putative MFS transporter|nr:MFS transporter [Terriglobia bacterium]
MKQKPAITTPSAAERLERVPLGRFHRRFIVLVSLGSWFDVFDIFMMAYLGAALQSSHFLTLAQFTSLIAAGFLGMFLGTIVLGAGSDSFGRRTAFVTMLLIYSVFSFAGALAPSPALLLAARVLAGVGIGAELVVIDTYVSEMVPSGARGRYVAITQLIGFTAIPVAALLARVLVPTHWLMAGWRWVMVIGSAGALFAWLLRRNLPESPRWLEARGRSRQAAVILSRIEREASQESLTPQASEAAPLEFSQRGQTGEAQRRLPFWELWKPPYRGRTFMLVVFHLLQTVGFYGFANWAPTFLLRQGHNLKASLDYGFLIALVSPLGPLLGVLTTERVERKRAIVVLALLVAVTGLGFPWASRLVAPAGAAAIVAIGAALTVFSYWFSSVLHAYQAELFPTRARATGVGFTYSWSRLSALASTLVIGALVARSVNAVFIFMAAAMGGVALVVGLWGPRTNAAALEEISE